MNLKKINESLKNALIENELLDATELLSETFSTIKSGKDVVIISKKGSGKSTAIVINVIQQLVSKSEDSPRAMIMVSDKTKVLEMKNIFDNLGINTDLRVFAIHDASDVEYDKNLISAGIDILIGTPNRLNEMFSAAGYNVNRLKMFIIDDADTILRLRHETKIERISTSITKTQRIIFAEEFTDRVDLLTTKILQNPTIFDYTQLLC